MSNVNRPLTGFRFVAVHNGDTLQSIAARELNDASKWRDIITINNLSYPYITADPNLASPNVKTYGDVIAVPASSNTVAADVDPNSVFKIDILLNKGLLDDDGNGDIQVVSGRDNYKQAISNRINTEQRELLFHLPYGCGLRTLLGTVNGPTAATLAAKYVKSAVEADPRTDSVSSAVATVTGDALEIEATAVPIAGAAISVNETIPV